MILDKNEKATIKTVLGNDLIDIIDKFDHSFVHVGYSSLLRSMVMLSANEALSFNSLIDSFAINVSDKYNFVKIYYNIYSQKLNNRLFVVVECNKEDSITSLTMLYENINWYEREIFEKFGIIFSEHPDIRPLFNNEEEVYKNSTVMSLFLKD